VRGADMARGDFGLALPDMDAASSSIIFESKLDTLRTALPLAACFLRHVGQKLVLYIFSRIQFLIDANHFIAHGTIVGTTPRERPDVTVTNEIHLRE